jgi:hypothetical protein
MRKKKEAKLTLKEAQMRVQEINSAFRLTQYGEEYTLNFGKGRGTYFTEDLQDAIDTALSANQQKAPNEGKNKNQKS